MLLLTFVTTLNGLHPSLKFITELPTNNMIPFIGIEIIKNGTEIENRVYSKPTNAGLLLHLQNHVASYALPFTTVAFNEEFARFAKLRFTFSRLDILST